jgi:hypothetical protein
MDRIKLKGRRRRLRDFALVRALPLLLLSFASAGCVTVRPEQRAVLADPTMQFEGDPGDSAAREHVLENREGSSGGKSIKGGGCGCN